MSFSSSLTHKKKREKYRDLRSDMMAQFKASLRKIHIDLIPLSDRDDVVREFLKYFKNVS